MKYGKSIPTIRKYFDQHLPVSGEIDVPDHPVEVVLDAFFWTRSAGVLVSRAEARNLIWREIESEKMDQYKALLNDLVTAGVQPASFTIDGRRGVKELLLQMFPTIPIQFCQFHQKQIITRYITENPRLEAGIDLKEIVSELKKNDEESFTRKLEKWHQRWCDFIRERTLDESRRGWH